MVFQPDERILRAFYRGLPKLVQLNTERAAKELGFIRAGHTKVEITVLPKEGIPYKSLQRKTHLPKLEPDSLPMIRYPNPDWMTKKAKE